MGFLILQKKTHETNVVLILTSVNHSCIQHQKILKRNHMVQDLISRDHESFTLSLTGY